MANYNPGAGGWNRYPDRNQNAKRIFFRADETWTDTLTVKSGYVIKAGSFLETIQTGADKGKAIPHLGMAEPNVIEFPASINAGDTIIFGALTFTAGSAAVTGEQLVSIYSGLIAGSTGVSNSYGTFSGTLGNWNVTTFADLVANPTYANQTPTYDTTKAISVTNTAALTNVTDLAITGTATGLTLAKVQGSTTFNKIAGVLMVDVDATSTDTVVPVYKMASFWSWAITWAVDPNVDFFIKPDGSQVAFSAYNTGCVGNPLLMRQFVEQSNFEPLGFESAGEQIALNNTGY